MGRCKNLAFGARGRFLRALEELGQVKAAAALTGVPCHELYRIRRRDPAFAAEWAAALAARPVIERGRGVVQRKRVTRRQWADGDAERAVAVAAETGSLKSVAARTGFSVDTVRSRRRRSPAFDAAMRAALAQATEALEAELLDRANEAMAVPGETAPVAVSFANALDLVKHRRAVEARDVRQGRGVAAVTEPSIEDVRDRVKAKLAALRRARGE